MNIFLAFIQAIIEILPIIQMIMQKNMAKDKELTDAKDALLKEWKDAYNSHDISRVNDVLSRMRQAQ